MSPHVTSRIHTNVPKKYFSTKLEVTQSALCVYRVHIRRLCLNGIDSAQKFSARASNAGLCGRVVECFGKPIE